jgi:hypothetical protein
MPMRILITAATAVGLSLALAFPSGAQPVLPEGLCFAPHHGPCGIAGVDPYGPNRFQAAQHNSCLMFCDQAYRICLMSLIEEPSPYPYCRLAEAACLQRCE